MDKTIAYKYVELSEDAEICILFLCGHTQRRTFLMSESDEPSGSGRDLFVSMAPCVGNGGEDGVVCWGLSYPLIQRQVMGRLSSSITH